MTTATLSESDRFHRKVMLILLVCTLVFAALIVYIAPLAGTLYLGMASGAGYVDEYPLQQMFTYITVGMLIFYTPTTIIALIVAWLLYTRNLNSKAWKAALFPAAWLLVDGVIFMIMLIWGTLYMNFAG